MVCQGCGASLEDSAHFCPKCGAQLVAAQPIYAAYPASGMHATKVRRHLQILGVLWCAFGAYRILGGLIGMFVLRSMTMHNFGSDGWPFGGSFLGPYGPHWIVALLPFIVVYTVFVSALALLVGYSLLTRRPWGRTLAIIVGVLTLLKPLLGTALGIYTLWVLTPASSAVEYEAIADRS